MHVTSTAARFAIAGAALLSLSTLAVATPALADSPFTGKTGALAFTVDTAKTQFKFLSDAPMEKVPGTADGVTGEITVANAAEPAGTVAKITVPVARMKTGNDMRDKHLQGPEWLNAEANKTISFEISKFEVGKVDGSRASGKAIGKFTMNGKSIDKTVPVELAYSADKNIMKITTKFKVSLREHGVKGKGDIIGTKVSSDVEVDCTLYAAGK